MQNNIIGKITPSIRLIILLILIINLFLANSIYLISFITILILILFMITDKKVNVYVKFLKKTFLLLLFFFLIYIIIFRQYDILNIVIIIYKLVLADILIKIFLLNIDFRGIHQALYGCLLPLKKSKINIEIFSLDLTLSIYFVKFLLESNDKIKVIQEINGRNVKNIKNYLIPRFIYSINELEKLKENLKIKFYNLNYKKSNFCSKFLLVAFVIFFIVCVFKEVIL